MSEQVSKAKVHEILVKAKALIDTPDKWTTGAAARTPSGAPVMASYEGACQFCSIGAVMRVVYDGVEGDYDFVYRATDAVYNAFVATHPERFGGLSEYNDKSRHEQVMVAWDKAIEDTA